MPTVGLECGNSIEAETQHDFGKQCYSNEHGEVPKRMTIQSGAICGASIQNTKYLSSQVTVG